MLCKQTHSQLKRFKTTFMSNLDESIHVASLAEKSCWSHWQFQRVFWWGNRAHVAQYIREIRLSKAADVYLLSSPKRHDIAYVVWLWFKISFSRAFKKYVLTASPRDTAKRKAQGLRTPYMTGQKNACCDKSEEALLRFEMKAGCFHLRCAMAGYTDHFSFDYQIL